MRNLSQLNYALVAKADRTQPLCAEDKSGMKGILVFYTKDSADDFLGQQGMRGAVVPLKVDGIGGLRRIAGPAGMPLYCVMELEDGKYEGEFFPFADSDSPSSASGGSLLDEAVKAGAVPSFEDWARKFSKDCEARAPKKKWWQFWK